MNEAHSTTNQNVMRRLEQLEMPKSKSTWYMRLELHFMRIDSKRTPKKLYITIVINVCDMYLYLGF